MKDKIVMFLLIACIFIMNIEIFVVSVKLDKAEERITIYEEDLNKLSSETDASIASMTDSMEEFQQIQENLASDLDATEKNLSSVTDAMLILLEGTTEEVTTEEPTTEEPVTEQPTTEAKKADVQQPTTEAPTEAKTEETTTESGSWNQSNNVYNITLTDQDILYLQRMAETETFGADMMSKTHVISVAMNRAITYGMSPYAVITSPNQFAYCNTAISQSTIDAVNYVLENGDTARGALFFHSGGYSETFCGRPCIFGDEVGHYFY